MHVVRTIEQPDNQNRRDLRGQAHDWARCDFCSREHDPRKSWIVFEEQVCSAPCAEAAGMRHYGRVSDNLIDELNKISLRIQSHEERRANKIFERLQQELFPEWKGASAWSVRIGIAPKVRPLWNTPLRDSSIDRRSKTIWIRTQHHTRLWIELIVSESCRVLAGGNEQKWHARMLRSAARAEDYGRSDLAGQILALLPDEDVAPQA